MGRVADREQTRAPPPRQPVERNREQLDLVPVLERIDHLGKPRVSPRDILSERRKAGATDLIGRALRNDISALPVVAAVELDQEGARPERAAGLVHRRFRLRQPEPQHVDWRTEVLLRQAGLVAQDRTPPVGRDGQTRPNLLAILEPQSGYAAVLDGEVDHFGHHPQREGRIVPRLLREEVEEFPLRHQGNETALNRQMAGIGKSDLPVRHSRSERAHLVVGALQELVEQPQFPQQLER